MLSVRLNDCIIDVWNIVTISDRTFVPNLTWDFDYKLILESDIFDTLYLFLCVLILHLY